MELPVQNDGTFYSRQSTYGSEEDSSSSFFKPDLMPIKMEMDQMFSQEISQSIPRVSRRTAVSGEEQDSNDSSFSTMSDLTSSTGTDTLESSDKDKFEDIQVSQSHSGSRKKTSKSDPRRLLNGGTKVRRLQANARERKRMHGLKEAFDILREHLPAWANNRKMSKYDTLLMAQTYIVRLQTILTDQVENNENH